MNECYQCIYRRDIPGDAHSRCAHPRIPKLSDIFSIYQEMTSGIKSQGVPKEQAIHVIGDPHGIRKGWFYWPVNFDPVWLISCNGFTAKEEK